jgi:hypothetical protein
MSSVGSATTGNITPSTGGASIQIALPSPQVVETFDNAQLEAAVQRVAQILYMRAHYEVPPSVLDVGGGIFDVLV